MWSWFQPMCGTLRPGASAKRRTRALEDAQAVEVAHLLAGAEEQLHAQADAQEGLAGGDDLVDGQHQAAQLQLGHALAEGAHAGQHGASADLMTMGSPVMTASAPARSRARWTLRRLPTP